MIFSARNYRLKYAWVFDVSPLRTAYVRSRVTSTASSPSRPINLSVIVGSAIICPCTLNHSTCSYRHATICLYCIVIWFCTSTRAHAMMAPDATWKSERFGCYQGVYSHRLQDLAWQLDEREPRSTEAVRFRERNHCFGLPVLCYAFCHSFDQLPVNSLQKKQKPQDDNSFSVTCLSRLLTFNSDVNKLYLYRH